MYIFKKNILCLYIKYISMSYKLYEYKYIHVNIFKIYNVYVVIIYKHITYISTT